MYNNGGGEASFNSFPMPEMIYNVYPTVGQMYQPYAPMRNSTPAIFNSSCGSIVYPFSASNSVASSIVPPQYGMHVDAGKAVYDPPKIAHPEPSNGSHYSGGPPSAYDSRLVSRTMSMNGASINAQREEYEVHDNQLKAPIVVSALTVLQTAGSDRLFSKPPKPIVYGSRNVVRICDAFQEGRCNAGEKCHDIHVDKDFLSKTRLQMSSWLMDREAEFHRTLVTNPKFTFRIFVADLKEVVEVPIGSLVFTKGLYVDPNTRAKRIRGTIAHPYSPAMTQVPTNCGLYASSPTQCKWGRWCNQVHISSEWMNTRKGAFDAWFRELQARYFSLSPFENFTVHDPQLRASIELPKYSIAGFSRGLFQGSQRKLASVCLLFQREKCTAGACCNQIHVVPRFLALVRELAMLDQNPSASAAQRARIERDMRELQVVCIAEQQKEMVLHMAEQAKTETPPVEEVSGPASSQTQTEEEVDRVAEVAAIVAAPVKEEDFESSGALFEHVHVDDDADTMSHTPSANASITRHLNTSTTEPGLPGVRQVNPNGSYSFNPYASVTSLPDGPSAYSVIPTNRVSYLASNGIDGNGISVQRTPGTVTLHTTASKGSRRLVAVVSTDATKDLSHSTGDEMNSSIGIGDSSITTALTEHSAPLPGNLRSYGARPPARGGLGNPMSCTDHFNSSNPTDFDASLHFSPSPLLGFDVSTTSMYRNSVTKEEDLGNHSTNLRLAISNTSHPCASALHNQSRRISIPSNSQGCTSSAMTNTSNTPLKGHHLTAFFGATKMATAVIQRHNISPLDSTMNVNVTTHVTSTQ